MAEIPGSGVLHELLPHSHLDRAEEWCKASSDMWVGALGSEAPECKSCGNGADSARFFLFSTINRPPKNGSHLCGTATWQHQVNKACQWRKKIWARLSALNQVFEMLGSHAIRSIRWPYRKWQNCFPNIWLVDHKKVDTDGCGKMHMSLSSVLGVIKLLVIKVLI